MAFQDPFHSKKMTKAQIAAFFKILQEENPHPETELHYKNAFTLLIAVILSAQATDAGVNKATAQLFEIVDTPEKMVKLGEEGLIQYIKTIGLYRAKAKNVIACSQRLIDHYGGVVPGRREDLESLAGVGRKTANVVLNVYFNQPTMAVDTHIFRVGNRTGLAPGKTPLEVERQLLKRVPDAYLFHAHHWLILLGRYICKARKPLCEQCKVREFCVYPQKTVS